MSNYYIIYIDNKFSGYTDDKEMLKNFLKRRKDKIYVKKMKEKDIPKKIKDSFLFHSYALTYFQGYSITTELPMFEYELMSFENSIREDMGSLYITLGNLASNIKYLQLNKGTKKKMNKVIDEILIQTLSIADNDHEVVYDDVVDVISYFNKRFNKKSNDNHFKGLS